MEQTGDAEQFSFKAFGRLGRKGDARFQRILRKGPKRCPKGVFLDGTFTDWTS